jgi:hypothetical protein
LSFFHYRQNNSGGKFFTDPHSGIGVDVIIEANTADEADRRARGIGLYFDGCENGRDCSCCGDRWYRASKFDRSEVPSHYGVPIEEATQWTDWTPNEPSGYIHYLNGSVEPFKLKVRKL